MALDGRDKPGHDVRLWSLRTANTYRYKSESRTPCRSRRKQPISRVKPARYSKGRRRLARINLGNCLAYVQSKLSCAALLFKGDDFSETDSESAA